MTEYTTSSEAIREYLTARDRTVDWVSRHFQYGPEDDFMSPSAPPTELDDSEAPSYGPSDSDDESTHSLPPRMILRWGDGRPDIPIAPDSRYAPHPPQPRTRSNHSTSKEPAFHPPGPPPPPSHHTVTHNPSVATTVPHQRPRWEQTLSYVSTQDLPGVDHNTPPRDSPEHIVVLPSPQDETVPQAPITSAPLHAVPPESHLQSSVSRTPTQAMYPGQPIVPPPPQPTATFMPPPEHEIVSPSPRRAYNPSNLSRHTTRSPPIAQSYSQPLPAPHGNARLYDHQPGSRAPSQLPYAYSPPAIVYAPSGRNGGTHYAPPAIVYSPGSHGHHPSARGSAPSIAYSHSAPLPHGHNSHHSHGSAPQYGSLRGAPSHLSATAVEEEPEGQARSRSRSHQRSVSRSHRREGSDAAYSAHSRGRSPAVISVPRSPARIPSQSPELSDGGSDTSGSTYYILPTPGQKVQIIHSPHSPYSPSSPSGSKKPFFQRFFSIPKLASSVNSRGSSSGSAARKLHRRPTVATHAQQHQA
ncbi:hypothetical protein EIP86_002730 [Pleurotus ostreatoroseus]|nr:hypothetical protein EIP86_002730 [Pleurotus ostreatoroseus]